jgi:L-alanine-DL-glutamate epimerase-like enolase superfamily enzyme
VKIVEMTTVRPQIQPNLCFVELRTDTGLVGLGEAFYGAGAVETYLHETAAPALFQLEEPSPSRVATALSPYVGYQSGGVEMRANGAIDIALWDLLARRAELPLGVLLGGPVRDSVRAYNTCAGPGYIAQSSQQSSSNWGLPADGSGGGYEDLQAFLTDPAALARELFDKGFRGMKVWPFDRAAERSKGWDINPADLAEGVRVVEAIRSEVGADMDIMIELHSLWAPAAATKICRALAPLAPFWVEDPVRADAIDALGSLRDRCEVPIALGETCAGRRGFLPLLQRGLIDFATLDAGWTGGLAEAVKVSALADLFSVAIAPHDCTGPVALAVATHLSTSQPNGVVQETVRAFVEGWYPALAEGYPRVLDGRIAPTGGSGHGVRLVEGLHERPDTICRRSTR